MVNIEIHSTWKQLVFLNAQQKYLPFCLQSVGRAEDEAINLVDTQGGNKFRLCQNDADAHKKGHMVYFCDIPCGTPGNNVLVRKIPYIALFPLGRKASQNYYQILPFFILPLSPMH